MADQNPMSPWTPNAASTAGLGPFRRLANFEQQAADALNYLRQKDEAVMALSQNRREDAVLGNFLAKSRTPEGKFDPFSESATAAAGGLALTRYAPLLDAFAGMEGIRMKQRAEKREQLTSMRPVFGPNGETYTPEPGIGRYVQSGMGELDHQTALNWSVFGDEQHKEAGNRYLAAEKEAKDKLDAGTSEELAYRKTKDIAERRASYRSAVETIQQFGQNSSVVGMYDKARNSITAPGDKDLMIGTMDPNQLIALLFGSRPTEEQRQRAIAIQEYAKGQLAARKARAQLKEFGDEASIDKIDEEYGYGAYAKAINPKDAKDDGETPVAGTGGMVRKIVNGKVVYVRK